jgi:O-antigen/teichoic acid export membrane protein
MGSQTKKITLDTAALFFGRAVGLLLGVVRLNFLATFLGVANFGILNFAAYFTALFQALFDLGLSQLLTREIARDLTRSRELLGRTVILKIAISSLSGILVLLVAAMSGFDPTTNVAILLTTVVVAFTSVSTAFLSAFQAHRKMVLVSIVSIFNDVILSSAIILLIPTFPRVTTALMLTVAVAMANLMVLAFLYVRTVGKPDFRIDLATWKFLLREGTPIAVSSFGISTYTFIGPTVLRYTRGEVEVGIFSAGYKLISILTLIPAAFSQVLFPVFSDFFANAQQKLHKALEDSLRVMIQISLPLAIGTAWLAPRIIAALFPPTFGSTTAVLQIIIVGNSVGYLAWILYTFLLALNRQTFCMWNSLTVATLVFCANIIAVPVYGYLAVAVVCLVTDITLFTTLMWYATRIGYGVKQPLVALKVALAGATMAGALHVLAAWPLLLLIVCGAGVYFVMLFVLGTFGEQERQIIAKVLRK